MADGKNDSGESGPAWTEATSPNADCPYDHCKCDTPLATALIEWKSWKQSPGYVLTIGGEFIRCLDTLDEAKATASAHFQTVVEQFAAWNTRAAPPAMDREAVETLLRDCALVMRNHETAWKFMRNRTGGITEEESRQNEAMAVQYRDIADRCDAVLSSLSVDAIPKAEGIDWSGALEAYHPDGRVEPVEFIYEDTAEAPQMRCTPVPSDCTVRWYNYDGSSPGTEWRIRNATPASHSIDGGEGA